MSLSIHARLPSCLSPLPRASCCCTTHILFQHLQHHHRQSFFANATLGVTTTTSYCLSQLTKQLVCPSTHVTSQQLDRRSIPVVTGPATCGRIALPAPRPEKARQYLCPCHLDLPKGWHHAPNRCLVRGAESICVFSSPAGAAAI